MNELVEKSLSSLVEELTTSGSRMLNEEKMTKLKKICKQSDVNVEFCYRLLHAQLNKNHSEIRYSTFQMIDQLFQRSHHFRNLLLTDFDYLIDHTLELTVDHQLPPPKAAARLLKQFAATSIKNWHEKFGPAYKLLDVGFNYLKNCRFVNFDNIDEPIGITAQIRREREEAERIRLNEKLRKATQELTDTASEINSCIKEAENCLDLLIPKSNRFSAPITTAEPMEEEKSPVLPAPEENNDDDDDDDDDDFIEVPIGTKPSDDQELLQLMGLTRAGKYNLTINLNERPKSSLFDVDLTEDNRALVENLHDLYRQLHDLYLKKVQGWMNVFIQVQQSSDGQQRTSAMKRAIDLKNSIQQCLKMVESYHLAPKKVVETPKSKTKLKATTAVEKTPNEQVTPPTLTEEEINYFFHGDSECLKRNLQQADVQNAFVRPIDRDDDGQRIDYSKLMRTRVFVSELAPIKWKCRAPIGNGKLCERMDRYKCPFHGRIIARNELGQAEDETIRLKEQQAAEKRTRTPDWQDPELLEDIRLATGLDLKIDPKKNKRKKKKVESNLTDISLEEDTTRTRLEKKIFNRASLKRIGAALDADERKRNYEKFHHQFNYSLNS